jgi:hypothetical protein
MSTKHTLTKDEFETLVGYFQVGFATMTTDYLVGCFLDRFDPLVECDRDALILRTAYIREIRSRRPLDRRVRIHDAAIEDELDHRLVKVGYVLMKPIGPANYGLFNIVPRHQGDVSDRWEKITLGMVESVTSHLEAGRRANDYA